MRFLAAICLIPLTAFADPSVKLDLPEEEAWTGQRVRFFIELRADGTFDGAPSFDLPQVPKTLIVKLGNPVLGSTTEDGTEFFTQRHEFALFSQADGALRLPPIQARFSHRIGYTGPTHEVELPTEAATVTLKRPPGSADIGFLVTTDSLAIEESWDPAPGPVETGAVFKRTITQRADNVTGMALAPAPDDAPDGVRSYPGSPVVTDRTDRGQLNSERSDTITYLVQQPGLHEMPAIRYDWWNPETETLESKTLPAVSFTATAPPPPPVKPSPLRFLWLLLPAALILALVFLRRPLRAGLQRLRELLDPPPKRARRALLRACRRNDADAAIRCWSRWAAYHPHFEASPDLHAEVTALERSRFGPDAGPSSWSGHQLARRFREDTRRPIHTAASSPLPPLNG